MLKLIEKIKQIFNKKYDLDNLTKEEFNNVLKHIIINIKESNNELF